MSFGKKERVIQEGSTQDIFMMKLGEYAQLQTADVLLLQVQEMNILIQKLTRMIIQING